MSVELASTKSKNSSLKFGYAKIGAETNETQDYNRIFHWGKNQGQWKSQACLSLNLLLRTAKFPRLRKSRDETT